MNKKNVKTPFNIVSSIIKRSYSEQQQQQQRGDGGAIRTWEQSNNKAISGGGSDWAAVGVADGR